MRFPTVQLVVIIIYCFYIGYSQISNSIRNYTNILNHLQYKEYITIFNNNDNELYTQNIPNSDSWNFIKDNIPFFDCPNRVFERTYYFRWWIFRKHIKKIKEIKISNNKIINYVITEFLPNVSWAGQYNTISAAASHHIRG